MSSAITSAPAWQQQRALLLHGAFKALAGSMEYEGANLVDGLRGIASRLDGIAIEGGRILRLSYSAAKNNWYRWIDGECTPASLICHYKAAQQKVPAALISDWQRRCSMPTGGRDKHGGGNISAVYARMASDWADGQEIPGLGTWQNWWSDTYPDLSVPAIAPDFPHCERVMRRYVPARALTKAGNIGAAAGRKHLPYVSIDYSKLRKCELFTLDDVRLDLVALDESTGRAVTVVCYIIMEVASRSIVAFVAKPSGTLISADVDELIVRALQTPGYGIGDGYTTHIKFERGTIACSDATQAKLEGFSEGGIRVHRTGMNGGIRWTGAAADRASGNAAGKAVIESFNRTLHGLLQHLPGQRGNNAGNQPANLGIELPDAKDALRTTNSTLVAEAERLYAASLAAVKAGADVRLKLPILTFREVRAKIADAIKTYNTTPGRAFQGHGQRMEAEIAPGVWSPVDSAACDDDDQPTTNNQ